MYLKKVEGPRAVKLADGSILTRADLPPDDTTRWVASRKAAVILGLQAGLVSQEEAMERWHLSEEELEEWKTAIDKHGPAALKATHIQQYRQP